MIEATETESAEMAMAVRLVDDLTRKQGFLYANRAQAIVVAITGIRAGKTAYLSSDNGISR